MKHVLIATGIFPPDIGGPASYVPKIAKRMLLDGLQPVVITYSDSAHADYDSQLGYHVVRVTRSRVFIWHYFKYFLMVLQRGRKCPVRFLQDYFSAGLPTLCANLFLHKKIITKVVGIFSREQAQTHGWTTDLLDKYVVTSQTWWLECIKKFETMLLNAAHQVMTPSYYMLDLLTRFGVSKNHISVIYNSFDPFPYTVIDVAKRKHELGITNKKIYVSVGRLVEWKHFDRLIEAFVLVPDAVLYIIGDGPLRSSLETLIQQTKQQDRIILCGALSKDAVYAYYQLADTFVLISSYEGMSHVLLEAMSMHLFIISSNIAPNSETLATYPNKRLVDLQGDLDLTIPIDLSVSAPNFSAFQFEQLYVHTIQLLHK